MIRNVEFVLSREPAQLFDIALVSIDEGIALDDGDFLIVPEIDAFGAAVMIDGGSPAHEEHVAILMPAHDGAIGDPVHALRAFGRIIVIAADKAVLRTHLRQGFEAGAEIADLDGGRRCIGDLLIAIELCVDVSNEAHDFFSLVK